MQWFQGIAGRQPVLHHGEPHPRVVRLVYEDGRQLVLKICKTSSTARCEAAALEALVEEKAPVPRLVEHDPRGLLIMEYVDGVRLGSMPREALEAAVPALLESWDRMHRAWQAVQSALEDHATHCRQDEFVDQMSELGEWLCPRAPYPEHAAGAWEQLVDLAVEAPRTFGSLDYNPYNVLKTGGRFVFLDFESVGLDWHHRRLWQYTTRFRDPQGNLCWHPVLRGELDFTPAVDAHYLLFAAVAIRRWNIHTQAGLTVSELWGSRGAGHPATAAWRSAWSTRRS